MNDCEDESFSEFLASYPQYKDSMVIDALRKEEYPHLDDRNQVCLDYTGMGIFSGKQKTSDGLCIGFTYTSANLATHAMYAEDTESFFRKRVLQHFNLDEDMYYIVFTANALTAFKLLGESYPFHEGPNLLLAYDHACESVDALCECAQAKGAHVQSTQLSRWSLRLDADDLRRKIQGKKKVGSTTIGASQGSKGLFVYPYSSLVTGRKNSSQWIAEAQHNGWHVLLDLRSSDPKMLDSLGLSLFLPDFFICSFYNIFGEDPTGFACLLIKKTVLRTLGDSSRARAIGMVKIVSKHSFSSPWLLPGSSREVNRSKRITKRFSLHKKHSSDILDINTKLLHRLDASKHYSNTDSPLDMDAPGPSWEKEGVQDTSSDNDPPAPASDGGSTSSNYDQEEIQPVPFNEKMPKNSTKKEIQTKTDNSLARLSLSPHGNASHQVSASLCQCDFDEKDETSERRTANKYAIRESVMQSVTCKGLDHADMLGYIKIGTRLRCLAKWLISSLSKLKHEFPECSSLVRVYSQTSSSDCASTIAFVLLDSSGEYIDPSRVQLLADRSNISIGTGIISGMLSAEQESDNKLGEESLMNCMDLAGYKWRSKGNAAEKLRLPVNYISLGFINNFSDVYKLWTFISRFLEPGFVKQELWHYQALNQETVEI